MFCNFKMVAVEEMTTVESKMIAIQNNILTKFVKLTKPDNTTKQIINRNRYYNN